MKNRKLPITLLVLAIMIVSFLFFTAFKNPFTEPPLTQSDVADRIEQLYNGEVQSISSRGEDYIISFKRNASIYEIASNRQDGHFSNLQLVHKAGVEDLPSDETASQEPPSKEENAAPPANSSNSAQEHAKLSEKKIIAIVKKQFDGVVDDIEYNRAADGGYYLVDIENDRDEATFQVHAITGKILSVSFDD